MDQFAKSAAFLALGLMLVPAAPAWAGPHRRVVAVRPCHAGWAVRRERPVHQVRGSAVVGVVAAAPLLAPWPNEASGPYPVGYDGSSATPTGYGAVYNFPPALTSPPRILYAHRQPAFPCENGVIVIRGGLVSAAY
ncbi:hypothetical protein [uncultured Rhodoblastus sp.]|uniref:hypothetical protein n=1 Tax=uncultured Rhodoblastus sp. TaxID=543037 RepID=UPI0025E2E81E|nr:hypothetical protein [uncultured Rhodoblastus sp.]